MSLACIHVLDANVARNVALDKLALCFLFQRVEDLFRYTGTQQ